MRETFIEFDESKCNQKHFNLNSIKFDKTIENS